MSFIHFIGKQIFSLSNTTIFMIPTNIFIYVLITFDGRSSEFDN